VKPIPYGSVTPVIIGVFSARVRFTVPSNSFQAAPTLQQPIPQSLASVQSRTFPAATFVDRLVQPETLPAVDIGHDPLPPILRPDANSGVLDIFSSGLAAPARGFHFILLQKRCLMQRASCIRVCS
jgi:hypothetical protein